MSKFSEKCKEWLIENGYNVYRLSQAASLERTTPVPYTHLDVYKRQILYFAFDKLCNRIFIYLPSIRHFISIDVYKRQVPFLLYFEDFSLLYYADNYN